MQPEPLLHLVRVQWPVKRVLAIPHCLVGYPAFPHPDS